MGRPKKEEKSRASRTVGVRLTPGEVEELEELVRQENAEREARGEEGGVTAGGLVRWLVRREVERRKRGLEVGFYFFKSEGLETWEKEGSTPPKAGVSFSNPSGGSEGGPMLVLWPAGRPGGGGQARGKLGAPSSSGPVGAPGRTPIVATEAATGAGALPEGRDLA